MVGVLVGLILVFVMIGVRAGIEPGRKLVGRSQQAPATSFGGSALPQRTSSTLLAPGLAAAIRRAGIRSQTARAAPVPFSGDAARAAVTIPGLSVQIDAKRAALRMRSQNGPESNWQLTPMSVGRAAQTAARPGPLKIHGARLTQSLGNAADVWYRASTRGLEQGFTIKRRPAGRAGLLTVAMRTSGSLTAAVASPTDLRLRSPRGEERFTYSHLKAVDARGAELAARFAISGRSVRILVEDAGAEYPITIDPLIAQTAKLTAIVGESGSGQLGISVALSADATTALVGGYADASNVGGAWVFTRSGGTWTQQGSKLTGSGEVGAGQFGYSVAISADGATALVGGYGDATSVGAAWVFTRSGSTWTQQGSKLTASGETGAGQFGRSVALSADASTALVGGSADASGVGAAWVFTRSGSTWTQQGSKLTGSGESGAGLVGSSVALSQDGSTALVGGGSDATGVGAAWVFTRSGATWAQQGSKLTGSGEAGAAQFGSSVTLSADGATALVGGFNDTSGVGAAWVFIRSGTSWGQQGAKLSGSGEAGAGQLGSSVTLSADGATALIGGSADASSAGAAWVFTRSGATWTEQGAKLTGSGEVGAGQFGSSVALSADGTFALVGGGADASSVGAAWGFTRSGSTWTQQGAKLTDTGEAGLGQFGGAVALSGDGTIALVGSDQDNGDVGAAWVFTRSGTTWTQQGAKLTASDEIGAGRFGGAVALSADGTTALIGGGSDDIGENGAAWVFTLSGTTWTQQGSKLTGGGWLGAGDVGGSTSVRFGTSVALSATGTTAVIGGSGDNSTVGAAWVFTRSGTTWAQQGAKLTGNGESGAGGFANSVAVSQDGTTAIFGGEADNSNIGAAWVFTRSGSSWTQQGAKLTGSGEIGVGVFGGRFGHSVALASDGTTALIGGYADASDVGAAWVFTRSGTTWTQQGSKLTGSGGVGDAEFGTSVALASDAGSALIGGRDDASNVGAAWLFTRSGITWTQQGAKLTASGEAGGAQFGSGVALSSDATTALIGAPRNASNVGAAWVFTWMPTTTNVDSSQNPSVAGQQVTYTATVSPTPSDGTVAFGDNGTTIAGCAAVAVNTGTGIAICQRTYQAVGSHSIVAAFAGGSGTGASASSTLTQVVNQAATTIVITSSLNPAKVGAQVTYTAAISPTAATGTVAFKDAGATISGCPAQLVTIGGSATCTISSYAAIGTHSISADYAGDSNYTGSSSSTLTQTVNPATTATTVSSSSNPSTVGVPVTYSATVTPAPDGGTVAFSDGGTTISGCGARPIDLATGIATCATAPYVATGTHSITASSSGDTNYAPSSTISPLIQTVNRAATTTIITSSLNPATVGQSVTFTATVSPAAGTGTVAFKDGATTISGCATQMVIAATATCSVTGYGTVGAHSISAIYTGDGNYIGSTASPVTETVNRAVTTTTLASSANPSEVGHAVTYTAAVTPAPDGGTVAFSDAGATISTCAARPVDAASGLATCTLTGYLAVGTHSISAIYAGNGNYVGSTSSTLTETITQAVTATTLSSSANPSQVGQAVTYSATISPAPDGGTVAFSDGGVTLAGCGAQIITNGSATCSFVAYTAVGVHTIGAAYSGDANYTSSTSSPRTQTVNPAATITTLFSNANPSLVGQPVTYTATVTPAPDGGTVAFSDSGLTISGCGARPIDAISGIAACTPPAYAAVGTHTITAASSGDANYDSSFSIPPLSQTVTQATVTSIASTLNPAIVGQQVTYVASLSPDIATGTVAFMDAGLTISGCGTQAVTSGSASCTVTGYAVGATHSISALYGGDTYYMGSTSTNLAQTILTPPTPTPATPTQTTPPATTPPPPNTTAAGRLPLSPALKFDSESATPAGAISLTITVSGATKIVGVAYLVPKVKKVGKLSLKTIQLGRVRVDASKAGKVKLQIRATKAALLLYRAHPGRYRITGTLTSLSAKHRLYTKPFVIGTHSLGVLASKN